MLNHLLHSAIVETTIWMLCGAVRPGWARGQHTGYRSSIPNTAGTQVTYPPVLRFLLGTWGCHHCHLPQKRAMKTKCIIKVDNHFKGQKRKKIYFSFCLTLGLKAKHHSSFPHGRHYPGSELKIFFPPKVLALRVFRMKMGREPAEKKILADVPLHLSSLLY